MHSFYISLQRTNAVELILKNFTSKSISRGLRIFSLAHCKQKLAGEMTRFRERTRTIASGREKSSLTHLSADSAFHQLVFHHISPISFCLLFTGLKMCKSRGIDFLVKRFGNRLDRVILVKTYCWNIICASPNHRKVVIAEHGRQWRIKWVLTGLQPGPPSVTGPNLVLCPIKDSFIYVYTVYRKGPFPRFSQGPHTIQP